MHSFLCYTHMAFSDVLELVEAAFRQKYKKNKNMLITKSQRWVILLHYKQNSLYPSSLPYAIQAWGMKITSLSTSSHYKHVLYNHILLYMTNTVDFWLNIKNQHPCKISRSTPCESYNLAFILLTVVNSLRLLSKFGD